MSAFGFLFAFRASRVLRIFDRPICVVLLSLVAASSRLASTRSCASVGVCALSFALQLYRSFASLFPSSFCFAHCSDLHRCGLSLAPLVGLLSLNRSRSHPHYNTIPLSLLFLACSTARSLCVAPLFPLLVISPQLARAVAPVASLS